MKYITPDVPNITITDYNGNENTIDFVCNIDIINLERGSILVLELPILDSDILLNTNTCNNITLQWEPKDMNWERTENKTDIYLDMKLIRKITSVGDGNKPIYKFIFYNGKDDVSDIINRFIGESPKDNTIKFAKVKANAIIPSKREEDAGYDIYPCFDEDYIVIYPHETKMIPTGIASAFSSDYVAILKERGSTGTKGIGQRCGVIDSGFRGEYFVPITNHNDKPIIIVKESFIKLLHERVILDTHFFKETYGVQKLYDVEWYNKFKMDYETIEYPYEKAICQMLILPVPKMVVEEVSYEELQAITSERGNGLLGSSNK